MSPNTSITYEPNLEITLRDGVKTYADLYKPSGPGKYPVLLCRTPYDKTSIASKTGFLDAIKAAERGYAIVIQDVRGRFSSEGKFYAFTSEIEDGFDSVEWAASQNWSTGKVGMFGSSYVGATQWLAAKAKPPSLIAIAPTVTASDYHNGWVWQGGAFELGFNLSWTASHVSANWPHLSDQYDLPEEIEGHLIAARDSLTENFHHLPLSEMALFKQGFARYYYDWIDHPEYDEYWDSISIEKSHGNIDVPALNIGGWYDIFLGGTLANFTGMQQNGPSEIARNGQQLIIGPWVHGNTGILAGDFSFGTMSSRDSVGLQDHILTFFDQWLKKDSPPSKATHPIKLFVMGENVWRDEEEWPPSRAKMTPYYLHSNGEANSLSGDGVLSKHKPHDEPHDVFMYNPQFPVPTTGGGLCCDPVFTRSGAYDQRWVEQRQDVLVYSTPPLEEAIEVTGPIKVSLFAMTSAADTDFTAKLVDVDPSGYARNLTDGIIRARYRNSRIKAELLNQGDIIEYEIDLWATSNLFQKDHLIRLEISSSNFPRFDRNLNTDADIGKDSKFVQALQTVYHTRKYPSHILLPIIPR